MSSVLTNVLRNESHELSLLQLKGVKLKVLRKLAEIKYCTRSELSKLTGLRISTLCSALDRLVKDGWVRSAFDQKDLETDRYVTVYTPTDNAELRIYNAGGVVAQHWQEGV